MLQIVALEHGAERTFVVEAFPCVIGRDPAADLRIESPGVWDQHAILNIRDARVFISPVSQSLLLLNGRSFEGGFIRLGDEVSLGGARIFASLAPAVQYRLASHEALIVALLVFAGVAQIILLLGLS
jgi:hypothetical protein